MKKIFILIILLSHFVGLSQKTSPYETDLLVDGSIITGVLGVNALGLTIIKNKDSLSLEKFNNLNKNDVWAFDRWSAGYNNDKASKTSDLPLIASLAVPFLFTLDKNTRQHAGQLSVMYVESVGISLAMFTMTAGLVEKSRPRIYSNELSDNIRRSNDNQRSFFSGHVGAAAASTFFAAKVYSDFYPNSKAKPYIWAGAAILPAVVGYYRVKGGNHFTSDVIVGYVVGTASGILVPHLHKRKEKNLKIAPEIGFGYQGIGVNYTF